MTRWRAIVMTSGITVAVAALAAILFVYSGFYNVAALSQHSRITNWVLHTVALRSIERRASAVRSPDLSDPGRITRGEQLFKQNCAACHGAPGVAPAAFAMGLTPAPPPLVQIAREWTASEIYWTTANGIKMTAMPPWRYRLSNDDIWAAVAFVETLPKLSVGDYKAMAAGGAPSSSNAVEETSSPEGDVLRGKVALSQYACASCHTIPGIVAPPGHVGPTLGDIGDRTVLAGLLANTPENMQTWIRAPQRIKPGTVMPDEGIAEQTARDMVAYLETIR